ncbi:unnamed protein product [Clonostachys byssicola]|uniref:Uncharacterized protein n=1 Tax=Clonostachys byssicola TaxID=160290 RepID=A0A9N9U4U7_9HYPO|nr:unnamed protein product [Clonostachys byssicola]
MGLLRNLCTLLNGIVHEFCNFAGSGLVDKGAMSCLWVRAISNLECPNNLDKSFDELIIDTILNKNTVGAYACLARALEFASDDTLDSKVEISIVEYHDGSITAQLQAELLDGVARLLHQ